MKAIDRARLTTALRAHVAKIAPDLRAKVRAPGAARVAAEKLHKDERVAEDFEVWTDVLSRRAAVLWVLKSVYVRVLEDRGLLAPGRLLDPEAQQLFEKLAPNLGETAFLRWIFKDLASSRGGVPELFSPQPAEVALPSDELSRALIALWRHRDADSGAVWSFAEEHFEGELMGDLYQELDPVVKERFALCQTPDFVRAFILDRTLTPAIETFGADEVRLLDPACGSGHFLIDGLKRLVAATAAKHADWDSAKVVSHALDRVVGVDLNDYACALARTRLIMTAAELAGVTKLADAARFHPHVYWADGLEQVEREEVKPMLQTDLFTKVEEKPRATLTRSDVRAALKEVFEKKFHAVVANPPYITESDDQRKSYHKEVIGGRPRYRTAFKEYHLSGPFVERCVQLGRANGFVGVIVDNQFMRRDYGKPLVEQILAAVDISLVVDTSFAHIPHHGTPTVLLFARNQAPSTERVQVITGRRGDHETPSDASRGAVWLGILDAWASGDFENDFVSSSSVPRLTLIKHPWSLMADDAEGVFAAITSTAKHHLKDWVKDAGAVVLTRADEVYLSPPGLLRQRFSPTEVRPFATGKAIRDWSVGADMDALFPYTAKLEAAVTSPALGRWLDAFKPLLKGRVAFGKTQVERGLKWFEYSMLFEKRVDAQLVLSNVATHNHFGRAVPSILFGSHAPCLHLKDSVSERDTLALLGVLNSSTTCFWMKQVFQPKGKTSANRNHPNPERFAYEIGTTQLKNLPLPNMVSRVEELARLVGAITRCAEERSEALSDRSWCKSLTSVSSLRTALDERWRTHDQARRRMIFLQEEIDWLVYHLSGLTTAWLRGPDGTFEMSRGQRAFERVHGHQSFVRRQQRLVPPDESECDVGARALAGEVEAVTRARQQEIEANPRVAQLERYLFKRLWRDTEENVPEREYRARHDRSQLEAWIESRIEALVARDSSRCFSIAKVASLIMSDREFQVVAEVLHGSPSFSPDGSLAMPSSRMLCRPTHFTSTRTAA